jgi:hypothetical protein
MDGRRARGHRRPMSTEATPASRAGALAARFVPSNLGAQRPRAWQEEARTRVASLSCRTSLARRRSDHPPAVADELARRIEEHLAVARTTAERPSRVGARATGADVARVGTNLRAAEEALLDLQGTAQLEGELPFVQARLTENLPKSHPQRRAAERAITERPSALTEADREVLASALREANAEAGRRLARLRSFRNLIFVATGVLTLAAAGLAFVGATVPDALPVCFVPDGKPVCPIGDAPQRLDLAILELVGLLGAAIAAASGLRRERGTATPYSVPVALGLLKLPTGALTAVLGLLLIHGEVVPGLAALDSSGQIVAWAILLGAGQQIFMRLVDQQGGVLLDAVRPPAQDER